MSNGKCSVSIFFSTTMRNRSLQTETWVLKVHLSEELWAMDLNNTNNSISLFTTVPELHSYNEYEHMKK